MWSITGYYIEASKIRMKRLREIDRNFALYSGLKTDLTVKIDVVIKGLSTRNWWQSNEG